MALAILELVGFEGPKVRFNIDTGTNKYYRLKVGRNVQHKGGIDWIDDVTSSTPLGINDAGGVLLKSSRDVSMPASYFDKDNAYVQLFSFKTAAGKAPAFSRVLHIPVGFTSPD